MSRNYYSTFKQAGKNSTVCINGFHVPSYALFGTFQGYKKTQVQWIVPEYPREKTHTILIYVWDMIHEKWIIPHEPLKKLYSHVYQIINNLNLWGLKTIPFVKKTKETIFFPSSTPYGKKTKMTALKRANTLHYQRGEQGNNADYVKRYGDIFSHGEWHSEVTKTISEDRGFVGRCSEHPLTKHAQKPGKMETGAFL